MPKPAKPFSRLHHSVLGVIGYLMSVHTGSFSEPNLESYREHLAWLRWRVTDGWLRNGPKCVAASEGLVRQLAQSVIADADALKL
jgi:hypothetical protein